MWDSVSQTGERYLHISIDLYVSNLALLISKANRLFDLATGLCFVENLVAPLTQPQRPQ